MVQRKLLTFFLSRKSCSPPAVCLQDIFSYNVEQSKGKRRCFIWFNDTLIDFSLYRTIVTER